MSERKIGEEIVSVLAVKAKKDEVRVYLSDGEKLAMSPDSFTEFHLYEGKELSLEEKIHEIATMISGGKVTNSQLEYAKEMILNKE